MKIVAVINQIVMLFIITGVGCFLQRKRVLTDAVIKGINSVVLLAAWPAMIIMTTQKQCEGETLQGFILVACVTAGILAIMCVVIYFCFARVCSEKEKSVFAVLSVMPNAGFVGLPIIQAVYGDLGVLYLAAFLVGFNLVLWTVGVFLFTGVRFSSLKGLLNGGVISAIIGTALFLKRITLPAPLLSTVNQLGALTTPLSMLLLGARLPKVQVKCLANPKLWATIGIKLLLIPVLTLGVMRLLNADATVTGLTVLAMAMPAASAAQMFAEKYDQDVEFSVQGVSLSMLLCIVTLPLILVLLGI